jgi:hypothetical protein
VNNDKRKAATAADVMNVELPLVLLTVESGDERDKIFFTATAMAVSFVCEIEI